MQYHFYLVIYSEFQVYFIACMSSICFIWYHAIMLHDERALNFTSLIYFLLSASIWHDSCLILSFDVIDYSFDWFCFTGHAQNKKEIKLQNIEISLDWKVSMVMVHS